MGLRINPITLKLDWYDPGISVLGDPVTPGHGGTGTSTVFTQNAVVFVGAGGIYDQDPTKFKYDKTSAYFSLHGGGTGTASALLHVLGTTTSHIGKFDIGIDLNPVVAPTGATIALVATPGNVNAGAHYYYVSYVTAIGETELGVTSPTGVTTTGGSGQVLVTLPISTDYRVTARRVYRTKANYPYWYDVQLVATISDNTTLTYQDNIADSSLATGGFIRTRDNTTNRSISVNGVQALLVSSQNTFVGLNAGANVLSGVSTAGENTFVGVNAGKLITGGAKNVAIGTFAFYGGNSDSCVVVGHGAASLSNNVFGGVYIGRNAGVYNTTGNSNIFIGYGSGAGTTYYASYYSLGIGEAALGKLSSGNGNVALGRQSSFETTSGAYNTSIGTYSGYNVTTGSYDITIGAYVTQPSATNSGRLNIGNVIFGSGLYQVATNSSSPTTGGVIGLGIVPSGGGRLELAAGSTTISAIKFTSGTNKTSPLAGDVEFNGTQLFLTPSSTRNILAQVSGETALTIGSIPFATTSGYLTQDNSKFFWDNSNKRLGIGTASPTYKVDIQDSVAGATGFGLRVKNTEPTGYSLVGTMSSTDQYAFLTTFGSTYAGGTFFQNNSGIISSRGIIFIGDYGLSSGGPSDISFLTGGNDPTTQTRMTITDTGNIGVNISTPTYTFDVKGTINAQSTPGAAPNYDNITYCNYTATNDYNGYPGAKFLIGQNAADVNISMLIGPLFATGATNKPAAIVVSTNASGVAATSYQTYIQQSTTLSQIITLNRSAATGATAGTPFAISIGTGISWTEKVRVTSVGTGFGVTSPSAIVHLVAGTATASTAPLKFSLPGVPLTVAAAGVMETDNETLYYTNSSAVRGTVRINRQVISSAATLTLDKGYTRFIFTGSSASTWTCFALASNTGKEFIVHNRGTADITLNSSAGATDFSDLGVAVASKTILAGETWHFYNDGTYFIIY